MAFGRYLIAMKAYEDVMLDHSTLVMPREEAYTDLFLLLQPKVCKNTNQVRKPTV